MKGYIRAESRLRATRALVIEVFSEVLETAGAGDEDTYLQSAEVLAGLRDESPSL